MSALQTNAILSGKYQLQVTYFYLFGKYWLLVTCVYLFGKHWLLVTCVYLFGKHWLLATCVYLFGKHWLLVTCVYLFGKHWLLVTRIRLIRLSLAKPLSKSKVVLLNNQNYFFPTHNIQNAIKNICMIRKLAQAFHGIEYIGVLWSKFPRFHLIDRKATTRNFLKYVTLPLSYLSKKIPSHSPKLRSKRSV